MELNEERLYRINDETRFTRFYYPDGRSESGLMLRWKPDSIYIQPRGTGLPMAIPTQGLTRIETVTGNRMLTGLAYGTLIAGGYFAAVQGWKLSNVTFGQALEKLFVPPIIILTAMGLGASKDTYEIYTVPPGFLFDYDIAKIQFQNRK